MTAITLDDAIVKFLIDNPAPLDSEIHALAKSLELTKELVEERIYTMLSAFLTKFGKHNDVPDGNFDERELANGIKVEMEHVDDPLIAKLIAKDHLSELPDYYTRLAAMEGNVPSTVASVIYRGSRHG